MAGRPLDLPVLESRRRRWSWAIIALAYLALVAFGVAIGSRLVSPGAGTRAPVTVTAAATTPAPPAAKLSQPLHARTRSAAVAAASAYVSELDGPALLDSARLRAIVARIAAIRARAQLIAAYDRVAAQVREQLGLDSVPPPVVIVRAAPVGYRLERFSAGTATVSIWRVGIVASGATVPPQQSWRTETVALRWEAGRWRVTSFASEPGPTPPLSAMAATPPGELFASIPRFQEFSRAQP